MFSSNGEPYDEQYYLLDDADIHLPEHVPTTSPDLFSFSPSSIDHGDKNPDFLQNQHELPFLSYSSNHPADTQSMEQQQIAADQDLLPFNSTKSKERALQKSSFASGDAQRRKLAKKDRHSKIVTAHGPRDRRMRLSLHIARKFFDLQDMLGYDKASKTVEWLMAESRSAIRKIIRGFSTSLAKSASSTSECEATSGVDETADDDAARDSREDNATVIKSSKVANSNPCRSKKIRPFRKPAHHTNARESRAMARARARERTCEKLWHRRLQESKQWTEGGPLEESVSHISHDKKSTMDEPGSHSPEHHQGSPYKDSVEDKSSTPLSGNSGPGPFFSISRGFNSHDLVSLQNHDMINNFQQNWDMNGTTNLVHVSVTSHDEGGTYTLSGDCPDIRLQPAFMDVQASIRQWETYSNRFAC